jgi:ribosomal protein S6
MNKYVLTVVLPAKGEGVDNYSEKLEKTVKALKGKVTKTTSLGKKQLAYQILKQSEGLFGELELEMESAAMLELSKKLAVDKQLLRHLLLKKA